MPVLTITSADDPRLAPYRDLKKSNLTRWSGQFIAEGWLVVERLLASDCQIESVLVSQRRRETIVPRMAPSTPILVIPQELAEGLLGYNFHAGVLACARRKENASLDRLIQRSGDEWSESHAGRRLDNPSVHGAGATLVVCDRIAGPENLGTIIRLSSAFGVAGLLLGPGCADPFSRRVLRVSMGGALALPIRESADLATDVTALRERGTYELIAAVVGDDAEPLSHVVRAARTAILLGNEALGIDPALVALCQRRVTIPVAPRADSLNVACAAAILLHHFSEDFASGNTD